MPSEQESPPVRPRTVRLTLAAALTGIPARTLRLWAARGKLRLYKPSVRVAMLDLDELERLVLAHPAAARSEQTEPGPQPAA